MVELHNIAMDDADQSQEISLTLNGVDNIEGARKLFLGLFKIDEDSPESKEVKIEKLESGEYRAHFHYCCWTRGGQAIWGICYYGNGFCTAQGYGCVA